MSKRIHGWIDPALLDADPSGENTAKFQAVDPAEANVVSSLCDVEHELHQPVLDIDFPCQLIPSSTPGHFHLYLDGIEMSWEKYGKLLVALEVAGVLGSGYVDHSLARGFSVVRLPHSRKGVKE